MVNARMVAWDAARSEIATVRPNLAELLNDCYVAQNGDLQASMKTIVAEYRYGSRITGDGWPYLPGEQPFPKEFIVSARLPLGIITENACESTEYAAMGNVSIPIAETILVPSDFIGLFEAVDVLTRVPLPPLPSWNIYAGISSIHALPNLATQQNLNRLARTFSRHIDEISFREADGLLAQLKLLPEFDSIANDWRVRIVYLSKDWLRAIGDHSRNGKVLENIIRRAWKNLARIRDKDAAPLQKKLREAVAPDHADVADAAGLLFKRISDVLARRQPCYTPVKENSIYGPFQDIADRILTHVTEENWILRPAYLSETLPIGYLKLEQVVPTALSSRGSGSVKDRVIHMMSVLRSAVVKENRAKHPSQEIISYMELLKRITFQTPSTKSTKNTKPSVYKIDFGGKLRHVTATELTQADFYSPLFAAMPSERCPFFRHALRIDADTLSPSSAATPDESCAFFTHTLSIDDEARQD